MPDNESFVPRVGGSFAPPITDDMILDWNTLREKTSGVTRMCIDQLYDLLNTHRDCPRNTMGGMPHMTGAAMMFPLSTRAKEQCEPLLPTKDELQVMGQLFDGLTDDVRDMAYHLLWYATELRLGREPVTSDYTEFDSIKE